MAKSGYEDFGDFEWDDFGDEGFGDFSAEPPKDDRNPATKLVGAFAEGVRDNLLNPSTQARFMRDVLPEGYVTALDTIDGITTGAKEILNEAKNAAKPIIKDLKRGTRLILPKVQAVLPDGIVKRLEEFGKDYDEKKNVKSLTPDEVEANATNVELGTIFNAHFEAQQKRDTQKDSEQQLKDIAFLKQGSNSLIIQYQLNENMKRLVEYNDQITAQYQRKSLEIQFKHYFVSRRLLNTMEKHLAITEPSYKLLIKNTGMPDIIKYKDHEKMVDQLKSQIFGRVTEPLSQWYRGVGSRIVKKAKGEITTFFSNVGSHINDAVMNGEQVQSDLADQLETVRDLGGDQAVDDLRIDLAGGAAGQFASDWVLKKFIDPIKKKLKENGTIGINELKLLRKFDRLPMQMRDFANSSTEEFNWLGAGKDLIKGAMGKNEIQTTIQKSGVDELEQQAYMTRKTIRTWEEVIPGWLSKIHQQVKVIATSDPNAEQEHYSFETASFQTSSQLKATLTERIAGKSKKNTLEYYTARVMKVIDPDGTKLSPDATKALRKYIIGLAWDGGKDFDPAKLMNEHNFPTTIPIAVKGEIVKHMRDRFDFDDTVELDDNNNFKGEPYKEEKETWEKLRSLSMGYASLAMNVPDAMKDALAAARQGQVGLLQEAGLATMESNGTYKLNRDKVLELLTAPELPPAAPPAPPSGAPAGPGLKDGGLFDGGSPLIHRVTGDVVDAPGSGANDTANAQLANREFVMNARSTNLPGMLPLLRYLNNLGNNDETLSQSIAAEDGVGTGSHVENAIHRFHDDFKTFGGDILQVSKEALSKMDKLTGFNIGLGNMEMPDLTEMRDKIKAFGSDIHDQALNYAEFTKQRGIKLKDKALGSLNISDELKQKLATLELMEMPNFSEMSDKIKAFGSDIHDQALNYAEFTKQRGIKLKDKALGSLNISDELKQKLATLELSAMFEDGIPDIKALEKKLKDLVSKEELAAITADYKKYHKRIEELRKQGMDLGERTAQSAARGATRAVGAMPKIIGWLRQKGKQQTDAGIARVKGIAGWGGDKVGLGYQKLKDKALGSLNISDELKQKLANLELSAMFEDGIPDIKALEKKLKDLVSKEELAAITAEYKKYHKRIEELRKQGMDLGERTAQRAARGATRAVGAVPKIIGWLRQKGKQQTDAGIARVKGIAGWGGDKVGLGYQKLKDMVSDVWVPGETRPRLYAAAIRAGAYVDVNTNKTIEVFDDITGEVRDKAGNIVISFEDYQKQLFNPNGKTILGFLTKKANQLKDLAMSPVKAMRARVGNLKNTLIDLFDGPEDVYVKGEMDKPRLYKRLMEMGVYRVKDSGVIVKRISDIKGVIEQVDGDKIEVVLTLDDFKKGIVNAKGEPFKTVSSFLSNLAKVALAKGFEAGKKVLDVAKNGMNFLTDILKSGGKRLGKFTGSFSDMINISMFASTKDVVNRLETIIEMLKSKGFKANEKPEEGKTDDSANPEQSPDGQNSDSPTEEAKPKGFLERMSDKAKAVKDRIGKRFKRGGDTDGDGDRDNSAADRAQRREEEGRRNEEKSRWAKLLDAMKEKGDNTKAKMTGMFDGIMTKFAPYIGMAATAISSFTTAVTKYLPFLGTIATKMGAAWKHVKGVGNVIKGAASSLWANKGTIGKAALRGGAAVLTGPVGWAIGAATLAYAGYKLYDYATREEAPLTKFRMAQYGYKHDDKDNVAKIITLEQECLKIVKVVPDQPAKLGSGKTLGELTQIFGVSMENQEDLEKWIMWFQHRFKPIFLMTVTELFKHTGKTNLTDIDKVLLTKQKLELIRTVNTLRVETNPYKVTTSPFAGQESVPLSMDDVKDAYDDAIDYIEDNADKNDQTVTASSGVKPKPEGKGWWETAKDSLGALGAGAMGLLSKAGQKVASVASAIGGGLATAGKATVNALGNGAKAVGGALAAGGGAIAAGASSAYHGAVDATSAAIEATANVFKTKPSDLKGDPKKNQLLVYQAFLNAGFSPAQAKALTAEVGRENDYASKYLYGIHGDPANGKINQGFISWQKERRDRLISHMASKDLIQPDGNFKPGIESLTEMAKFLRWEIEKSGGYKTAKREFLDVPDIDSERAAWILGKYFVGWRIEDPKYAASGHGRRRSHERSLEQQLAKTPALSSAPVIASTTPTKPSAATPLGITKTPETSTSPLVKASFSPTPSSDKPIMMQGVTESPKATPVAEVKRTEAAKVQNKEMEGMALLAREQLRLQTRSADTLDNIFALMQRMEKQATSKPANPAQRLPNPEAKPTPKSPIDVSRTY